MNEQIEMNQVTTNLVGGNPEFLRLLHTMRMVAATDAGVMINGEKGVGKTTLAGEIHACSRRRNQPFVSINCAGMSDTAFAAIFPGGVQQESAGNLEIPLCGTLFLDEVGELSDRSQSMLFHFLDTSGLDRDLRVVSSSSRNLMDMVTKSEFREDLFYRLYVVPLDLPPLRERPEDLVVLLKHFSRGISADYKRPAPQYSVGARNLLKAYSWPGNLRELRNLCERMVILMAGRTVQPENLPLEIRRGNSDRNANPLFALPADGVDLLAVENDMIRQALGMAGGNRSKAARLLHLTRDTLLYRIQKHNIKI